MLSVSIQFPGIGVRSRDWLEHHPDETQAILAECKGRYPKCLCRPAGVELYIACRTRFYLARLPNSGPRHAPFCPSYEPDPSLCGRGVYSSAALSDRTDGRTSVKLDVPLLIRGGGGEPPPIGPLSGAANRTTRDTMTLRGLLHLLWERAGFNRWSPRMAGRRHYRQLHKYVLEAAESVIVGRRALTSHLYMPEPFEKAHSLEIEARRRRVFNTLSRTASGAPKRLMVLGQVKVLTQSAHGSGIRFAHTPPAFVVWYDRGLGGRLERAARFAFLEWPILHPEFHLIVLLTMQRTRQGKWKADALASMVTTTDYIPVDSIDEAILSKRLVESERYFYKPLSYDSDGDRFPNFLLSDAADVPVPLEIVSRAGVAGAARNLRIAHYLERDQPHWTWDVHEDREPPALLSRFRSAS